MIVNLKLEIYLRLGNFNKYPFKNFRLFEESQNKAKRFYENGPYVCKLYKALKLLP